MEIRSRRWGARVAAVGMGLLGVPVAPLSLSAAAAVLRVGGMTFVGSRGSVRELVLESRVAVFRPEARIAELQHVSATVSTQGDDPGFSMSCDRAELNLDSNDFIAEGNVEGETGDGRRYFASWVRYEHEEGVLYTDAPARMVDGAGSFRGDGFRYDVRERRFKLLGDVRVEQAP